MPGSLPDMGAVKPASLKGDRRGLHSEMRQKRVPLALKHLWRGLSPLTALCCWRKQCWVEDAESDTRLGPHPAI